MYTVTEGLIIIFGTIILVLLLIITIALIVIAMK